MQATAHEPIELYLQAEGVPRRASSDERLLEITAVRIRYGYRRIMALLKENADWWERIVSTASTSSLKNDSLGLVVLPVSQIDVL
jgi:hypothetical protein